MIRRFGNFEVDEQACELRFAGKVVAIQPKPFQVLAYLLANQDRVVTKNELLDHFWQGEEVSEASLTFSISALRRALAVDQGAEDFVKSVRGRGYRWLGDSRTQAPDAAADPPAPGSVVLASHADRITPFVGREAEQIVFRNLLDRVLDGSGQILLLTGEPGIGKTRTMHELAAIAAQRQACVLNGSGFAGDGNLPFLIWISAMRTYIASQDIDTLRAVLGPGAADIAHVVPTIRDKLPDLRESPPLDPEQARLRLFASFADFLSRAAAHQPVVVCLDDLQWADRSSLLLLQYLANDLGSLRLLVFGTFRSRVVEPNETLDSVVSSLRRSGQVTLLPLQGLPAHEMSDLLHSIRGAAELPERFVATVTERAEGNPFFVEQLCRHLAEGENGGTLAEHIPLGVRDLITQRLDRLDEATRRIMRTASVNGRQFSHSLLTQVAGGEAAVMEALEAAQRAQLIVEMPNPIGHFRFAHALIHETLYAELSTVRRTHLHNLIGAELESQSATDPSVHAVELAHHFLAGAAQGATSKAVHWARAAARRAAVQLAHEEAAHLLERALQAIEHTPQATQVLGVELLVELGEAQMRAGAADSATATFERAATLARALSEPSLFARAAMGAVGPRPTLDAVPLHLLEEALPMLGPADAAWRARVVVRLALRLAHTAGASARRESLAREALHEARRLADPQLLAAVLQDALSALFHLTSLDERWHLATEALEVAHATGVREAEMVARIWRVTHWMELGEFPAMDREIGEYARLADETRQQAWKWHALYLAATRALVRADLGQAESLSLQALELGRRMGEPSNSFVAFTIQRFSLLRLRGNLEEVENFLRSSAEESPIVQFQWLLPLVYLETNRAEDARAEFERLATRHFEDLTTEDGIGGGVPLTVLLAEACAALDDVPRAALLYDKLNPYAERWVVAGVAVASFGCVARYLGLLAATQKRWDVAVVHFEYALQAHTAMQARAELALTQADYAQTLRRRGRRLDQKRATQLMQEAAASAQELELGGVSARIERYSATSTVPSQPSARRRIGAAMTIVATNTSRRG